MSSDGRAVEAGLLEDIHITADPRTNTVAVSAPPKVMDMVVTLIKEYDAIRPLKAEIRIFPLKKGDAATVVNTLQQLFQSSATGTSPGIPRPVSGGTTATTALGTTGTPNPLAVGAPLVDLRLSYDSVTNSVIVAGSQLDLVTVEALILRLEASGYEARRNEVYLLRNALAADTANTLTTFFTNSTAILKTNAIINAEQDVEREIIIVPDPITNKLLISVTPTYYPEVMRLIQELDADIPQVVIQVLLAEVDLSGSEEFGVELGLQTPVLFNRSIYPGQGVAATSTSFGVSTTGPSTVPSGVTTTTTIPVSNLGYNFNNPLQGLGNNIVSTVSNPALIGYQGLTSLGVGRVSPANNGISGFVFSASSDTFNLLIRALKTQGRLDVLSRPQVQTLDNQSARVFVGQSFPIITGTTTTATGFATSSVTYEPVGVELLVTPKIEPDGKILMRVTPTVASPQATSVSLSPGITLTAVNQQTVDTTVIAQDGETVAIGGLITRSDNKVENKVPWLGDLPIIGTAFRFRTQTKAKNELLVIMTPHIVRTRADADQVLAQEAKRMDWVTGEIFRAHNTTGLEPIIPTPPPGKSPNGQAPIYPPTVIIPGQTPSLHPPEPQPSYYAPEPLGNPLLVPPGQPLPQSQAPVQPMSLPQAQVQPLSVPQAQVQPLPPPPLPPLSAQPNPNVVPQSYNPAPPQTQMQQQAQMQPPPRIPTAAQPAMLPARQMAWPPVQQQPASEPGLMQPPPAWSDPLPPPYGH